MTSGHWVCLKNEGFQSLFDFFIFSLTMHFKRVLWMECTTRSVHSFTYLIIPTNDLLFFSYYMPIVAGIGLMLVWFLTRRTSFKKWPAWVSTISITGISVSSENHWLKFLFLKFLFLVSFTKADIDIVIFFFFLLFCLHIISMNVFHL